MDDASIVIVRLLDRWFRARKAHRKARWRKKWARFAKEGENDQGRVDRGNGHGDRRENADDAERHKCCAEGE